MAESEQLTRHEREIGELRGKLDALATKEFVRGVVNDQTQELSGRFDGITRQFDGITRQFERITQTLNVLKEKQHRITGAADFLKTVLPILISLGTLILLIASLLLSGR